MNLQLQDKFCGQQPSADGNFQIIILKPFSANFNIRYSGQVSKHHRKVIDFRCEENIVFKQILRITEINECHHVYTETQVFGYHHRLKKKRTKKKGFFGYSHSGS